MLIAPGICSIALGVRLPVTITPLIWATSAGFFLATASSSALPCGAGCCGGGVSWACARDATEDASRMEAIAAESGLIMATWFPVVDAAEARRERLWTAVDC